MPDICDMSDDRIEIELQENIKKVTNNLGPVVQATGRCLFSDCGKELPPGQRWCDADHRDEWEFEQRQLKARNLQRTVEQIESKIQPVKNKK